MTIPDEVSFEASALESDNDAYQYVWDQARKEALKEVFKFVYDLWWSPAHELLGEMPELGALYESYTNGEYQPSPEFKPRSG